MTPKHLLAAATIGLAAGTAFAEGPMDYPPAPAMDAPLSRAQVLADLREARAEGWQPVGEVETHTPTAAASTRTRAEVRAEARASRGQPSPLHRPA